MNRLLQNQSFKKVNILGFIFIIVLLFILIGLVAFSCFNQYKEDIKEQWKVLT